MAPPRETTLPAANRTFVDRERPQRVFEDAAFSIPNDRAILRVFYGVGGQGKTALCRELMRKTDGTVDPTYSFLRRTLLDLHGRQKNDADLLLVWIRNGFADSCVALPCFDLALALIWEGTRGEQLFPLLTKPWLARSTKAAQGAVDEGASEIQKLLGTETVKQLLGEAASEIPGVGFLLKHIGNWVIDKTKRVYLQRTREHLRRLYYQEGENKGKLKPPYELSELLPWMLAQDLNYHLSRHPADRFVLFIDEYERVFEQGGLEQAGTRPRWKENPFDNHLRALVRETNGLLVAFFSREQLPWSEHPDWREDLRDNQHLLGGLSVQDADEFLKAIPIADDAIRQAIIDGAHERPDETAAVYPLMLDLQVEHWRVLSAKGKASPEQFTIAAGSFEARRIELVERVLRDYADPLRTTLEHLSVARRFDREAFDHVVRTCGTALPPVSFDRIASLSFVTRSDDGFLTLHNMVAEAIRETLSNDMRRKSLEVLLEHFSSRAEVHSLRKVTQANITALIEAAYLRYAKGVHGYAEWLSQATKPIRVAGQYAPLTALWRDALIIIEKALGTKHPDTATSLDNLAMLLLAQGDYGRARPLLERALAIRETVLGAEHPKTANSASNLAAFFEAQGNYTKARSLSERALAISEKALGPEHPDTAIGLNNLAHVLHSQGDAAGARPLYERALVIQEKVFGVVLPSTVDNFANVLQAQGDYAGARLLYERALAMFESVLGPEHPDTGECLKNLARLHEVEDDHAGALPLLERALAISEKVVGAEHPETGTILANMAGLLAARNDYAGARSLYERALAISEKALGAEHPDSATILKNLAMFFLIQGDHARARPLFERELAIREKTSGAEHPDTTKSIVDVACALFIQGDYAGARPLFERALAIYTKVSGAKHPNTVASLNNLARVLEAQGDFAGARSLFERAEATRRELLRSQHSKTVTTGEKVGRNALCPCGSGKKYKRCHGSLG